MDGENKPGAPEVYQPRVAICTPIGREVSPDHMLSVVSLTAQRFCPISLFNVVGHANVPRARNFLVARALAAGADEIVFIDADIGFEPEAFARLFQYPDLDIVAGAPQRRMPKETVFCASLDPVGRYHGDLISGYAATAFLRIKRSVFEKLEAVTQEYDYQGTACRDYFMYHVGLNPSGKTKGLVGEDFHFSMLARENGIDVWIDPAIRLRHWTNVALEAVMADHIKVTRQEDAPQKESVDG